jgi:hypothetical protein
MAPAIAIHKGKSCVKILEALKSSTLGLPRMKATKKKPARGGAGGTIGELAFGEILWFL